MSDFEVLHVVRRYGPVGGMESYVWELTHTLANLGVKIEVICEELCDQPSSAIQVHKVIKDTSRSRWRAMINFRARVDALIANQFVNRRPIIHSHERTLNHDITTFHGPPMVPKSNWWRFSWLSPRVKAWKLMEKEEIFGPKVKVVLPVSNRIKEHLVSLHPDIKNKSIIVAYPGIHEVSLKQTAPIRNTKIDARFVFIGREWKRKGLSKAVEVCEALASRHPVQLDVFGVDSIDVPNSLAPPFVKFWGYQAEVPFEQYDLLVHPAVSEPFGMVVSEARASGVPVLISDNVGASDLNFSEVKTMRLSDPLEHWSLAIVDLVSQSTRIPETIWSWDHLVDLHIKDIYPKITAVYAS